MINKIFGNCWLTLTEFWEEQVQPGETTQETARGGLLSGGSARIQGSWQMEVSSSLCVAFQKVPWEEEYRQE